MIGILRLVIPRPSKAQSPESVTPAFPVGFPTSSETLVTMDRGLRPPKSAVADFGNLTCRMTRAALSRADAGDELAGAAGERGGLPAKLRGGGQDPIGAASGTVHEIAHAGDAVGNFAGARRGAVDRFGDSARDEILLMHRVGNR